MSFFKTTGEKILDKGKKGGGLILSGAKTGGSKLINGVGNIIDTVAPVPLAKTHIEEEKIIEP